jgi:nucleotide-binding universal stress UspA family protein
MRPFRFILALADFSPKSDNAVRRAALMARQHRATLHLLHVVEPAPPADLASWTTKRPDTEVRAARAYRSLTALATRISRDHRVTVMHAVRAGDAVAEIRDAARSMDLVVIGAKRTNPLREFVLGTPTERLLRILARPILVVSFRQTPPTPAHWFRWG